jgi:hypothetical protein
MNRNCHVTDDVFCYSNKKESIASSQDNFCVNVFTVHSVMTLEIAVVGCILPREIINYPFFVTFFILHNGVHGFPFWYKTLRVVILVKTLSEECTIEWYASEI